MLTPSCPVPLVQCQCFLVSSDLCIGVTGDVRDTKLIPPSGKNVRRSPAIYCSSPPLLIQITPLKRNIFCHL
ncbi:unnamed protein product [Staurois parvus]|uniref:Uncharacterized protein n=1 Tax=Staurois parvus TaxID=386267 RepID=A0ABN9DML6_9NEOB|nr:unnamed protein product [Staurois parvus]